VADEYVSHWHYTLNSESEPGARLGTRVKTADEVDEPSMDRSGNMALLWRLGAQYHILYVHIRHSENSAFL
jgi:hypothetical protein